jgi:spore germination cell wall hydrolase CwlJ-like protein
VVKPAPGLPIEQQSEPWIIRACVWAEARGETRRGQLAVLHVIRNRALHSDTTLKVQVLKPWQFSSFNAADQTGQRAAMLKAHETDPKDWAAIDAVCELFEQGSTEDPTEGARHYYVTDMPNPPKWGRGHPGWMEHCVLGAHVFGIAA